MVNVELRLNGVFVHRAAYHKYKVVLAGFENIKKVGNLYLCDCRTCRLSRPLWVTMTVKEGHVWITVFTIVLEFKFQ